MDLNFVHIGNRRIKIDNIEIISFLYICIFILILLINNTHSINFYNEF